MYTYLISIVTIFIIILIIKKEKAFSNVVISALFCIIGAIIVSSVVNLIRISDLKRQNVRYESYTLKDFKINPDSAYVLPDTIINKDSIKISKSYINNYKITINIDRDLVKKIKIKTNDTTTKFFLDSTNKIYIKYNDRTVLLDSNIIIIPNKKDKYIINEYIEKYIGDNWTSSISLPFIRIFYVLSIPEKDVAKLLTVKK